MASTSATRLFTGLPSAGKSTSKSPLQKAIAARDPQAFHAEWNRMLEQPRQRLLKKRCCADLMCMWSVDDIELSGRERELAASIDDLADLRFKVAFARSNSRKSLERLTQAFVEIISNWLAEADHLIAPWETIAICELLLWCGPVLPPETLLASCRILLTEPSVEDQDEHDTEVPVPDQDRVGLQQTLEAEARWLRELTLSPFGRASLESDAASTELNRILVECTDPDGMLHGSLLSHVREWLAPMVRAVVWGASFQRELWTAANHDRFRELVEKTAALSGTRGDLCSLNEVTPAPDSEPSLRGDSTLLILQQAARSMGFKSSGKVRRLLSLLSSARRSEREVRRTLRTLCKDAGSKRKSSRKAGRAGMWQSDQSCTSIMRSGFSAAADLLVADWHKSDVRIHLTALGLPVLAGPWLWKISTATDDVSSVPLSIPESVTWNCTCWFVDEEVAFAELEAQHLSGFRLHRHILLAPADHFAILTDSVTCDDPDQSFSYETRLPLIPGLTTDPDQVTRELRLLSGDRSIRAFPLWLEDDRVQHAFGSLETDDSSIRMSARSRGGLIVPLVLDWHPARSDQPADWSKLTVAESRRNVASHEAGAARLRIGTHQILVYRSLKSPVVNRTVLGLHTGDESVYGRVPAGGQVEPLVQVEGSAADEGVQST